MAYATTGDLVTRWRTLNTAEITKANILLDDAAFWLRMWVPGLAAAVDAGGDAATGAKLLSVSMVKRAMLADGVESPGVESIQQTSGIYTDHVTYRNPEGNLYLYDRELQDLINAICARPAGASSHTSPGL